MHLNVPELIVNKLLATQRPQGCYIWVTLTPETNSLTPRTLSQIMLVVKCASEHARVNLCLDVENKNKIKLSKLDVALDLQGSFIPRRGLETYR